MKNIEITLPPIMFRSKTNGGDLSKYYFWASKSEVDEEAIIIKKLVLSDDTTLAEDFKLLRSYKGTGLYQQVFAIKVDTLKFILYAHMKYTEIGNETEKAAQDEIQSAAKNFANKIPMANKLVWKSARAGFIQGAKWAIDRISK